MSPFLKKSSKCWFITVPRRNGTYARLSSGTRNYDTAVLMQGMATELSRRGSRSWEIIDAMTTGPRPARLKVADAFDYYPERLDELRAHLARKGIDEDLAQAIDEWDANLDERIKARELKLPTVVHYRRQVTAIFPQDVAWVGFNEVFTRRPVPKSRLTADWFKAQLKAVGGSGTNKRRHAAAWSSCLAYLVEDGKLERNPLDDVKLPKNNKTDPPHIVRLEDVIRFVNHVKAGPHRAAAALREGAGVELQAMLATRKRDIVDVENRIIWAHGEKNEFRDRQVVVDEWAWKILMAYVKANPMLEDAPLFPGVTERSHRAEVVRVRDELRAQGVNIPANYKPHNCRNTFAVRGMREGRDPILLANNLGHSDTSEVTRRYGKFRPALTDLVRADRRGKKES